ncbi:MAG: class I SAM-dependent methyltransferase [Alphaproteobacteria bacterium]
MPQTKHAILVDADHDEAARQHFAVGLKSHLSGNVAPGTKSVYENRVKPAFRRAKGRVPTTRHEVRRALSEDSYYQAASALKRTAQELMWDSVGEPVARRWSDLKARAGTVRGRGSLRLDPALEIPRYHAAVDIHCMPGGYHSELGEDDLFAGALYDRGIYLFSMGLRGTLNDDFGQSLVAWVKENHPGLSPKRILDMGCSVGHGTLPWCDAFPNAEVHAFDIGAPMVRYAHARAQALGKTVHFSQQNAETTDFPDAHFDLIVSQIIIHETSRRALPRILRECHRLLKPGGVMLHMDGVDWRGLDPYDAFVPDWDTYFNNEPFIGPMHDLDLPQLASDVGFARDKVIYTTATSARRDRENRGRRELASGDFGNVGAFMVFGGVKE